MIRNNIYYSQKYKLNKKIIISIILIIMTLYFILHSIIGDRGILSYFKLKEQLIVEKDNLSEVQIKRIKLEDKALLLRTDSLDVDMLDEVAREVLDVSKSNEQIINNQQ